MKLLLAWLVIGPLAAAAFAVSASRAASAHGQAAAARQRLSVLARDAQELLSLRAATSDETARAGRASGLAPRIGAVLTRCGLPASCLSSLSPEAEVPVPGSDGQPRLRRQRATLILASLTLPQAGSFLDAWRSAESGWAVTSLDFSPAASNAGPAGGDLPLRLVLSLETVFAADSLQGVPTAPSMPHATIRTTGGAR